MARDSGHECLLRIRAGQSMVSNHIDRVTRTTNEEKQHTRFFICKHERGLNLRDWGLAWSGE